MAHVEGHRLPRVGDIYQQVRKDKAIVRQLVIGVDEGLVFLGDGVGHLFTELINPREWTLLSVAKPAVKQVVVPHGTGAQPLAEAIRKERH